MPQALALAAQIVATVSLLVIPLIGLFLLSLAVRQGMARVASAPVRQLPHQPQAARKKSITR